MMRAFRLLVTLGLTAAVFGCADTTGSITEVNSAAITPAAALSGDSGNPDPISADPLGPALETTHAEFWAVQGKRSEVAIDYRPASDGGAQEAFLRLTIPAKTHLVDPNGHRLTRGDSILIKVHVVPGRLAAEFSPHGLMFADSIPALLAISYRYGETGARPVKQLGMWYLPCDGGYAEEQWSKVNTHAQMVVGRLYHFSNYAVAYRK